MLDGQLSERRTHPDFHSTNLVEDFLNPIAEQTFSDASFPAFLTKKAIAKAETLTP